MAVPAPIAQPRLPMRAWSVLRAAVSGYGRHGLPQHAAAISYRVLFSLVPLVAFAVYIVDLVLPTDRRQELADWAISRTAGTPELQDSVRRSLEGVTGFASVTGVIAIVALLWAASGMMGSIRAAFTGIWEADCARPFVRGKLLDVGLVVAAGAVALAGFATSLLVRIVGGLLGSATGSVLGIAASLGLTAGALLVLYRLVPPRRPPWAALWPGALAGAIAFELATVGYGIYLSRFGDLSVVYGSLGAMLGFLLVVYVGAVALLLGAEVVVALDGDARREREDPDERAQEDHAAQS